MAGSIAAGALAWPLRQPCLASLGTQSLHARRAPRRIRCTLDDDPPPSPSAPSAAREAPSRTARRKLWWRKPQWRRIFFASGKVRSVILLNVLTVIYASDIPVLKEVEAISEPAFFNMVRFTVSAIPFLPYVIKACGDCYTRSAGLELGLWISLGYLTQAIGLLTSDAGRASFISAFTVVVVPLIEGIFGAAVPRLTWLGAIFSLVGVGMLESSGSPPSVGDILNFMSAVFFGIHILRTKQISRSMKKDKFLALVSFEVLVVAASSVIWFIVRDSCNSTHPISSDSLTSPVLWDLVVSFPWIPAIYTGAFSTVLCLWAEMYAMKNVSATETALIYGLEPVWGAAFAWFLLDERWDMTAWAGAALVLCGSLTVQIFGSSSEFPEKSELNRRDQSVQKKESVKLSAVLIDTRTKS